MARLVLGTNKSVKIPAIVRDVSPAYYIEKTKDANGKAQNSSYLMDLSTFTDVGDYVFYYTYSNNRSVASAVDLGSLTTVSGSYGCAHMFQECRGLTSVDLSSLTTIMGNFGCSYMFESCTDITRIDLSSLTTVAGYGCQYMFNKCTGLTSVDLSSLTTVSGSYGCVNMFGACTGITSVDLSSLTTVSGSNGCQNMFSGCTGITSVDLSSLTTVSGQRGCAQMFSGCISLSSLSFPALTSTSFGSYTNQFTNMLSGVTGCTVHFPSNLQSVIGSWSDVTAGFGGTNTTVLFDLAATN